MKTKIKVKNLYLIAIITIGLVGLGVGSTFAIFDALASIDNPITFNSNLTSADNLSETIEVTVPAGEDKYVDIVISNTFSGNLNYAVWCSSSSNDLSVGSESSNNSYGPVGTLPSAGNFTLTVGLRNSGSAPITVTIGISSSGDAVVLPSGVTQVPSTKLPINNFYSVLKNLAADGRFAKKYEGNHQDSMNSNESNKDIYYFYAGNDADGNTVRNMNNVVFGGQCWQIIRTTDTGGIKLLYNGEPTVTVENGETKYDCGDTRPGHIGGKSGNLSLSGTYYYAKEYTASLSGTTTTFTLVDPVQVEVTTSNAEEKIAEIAQNYPYTCKNTTGTCTNSAFYKVLGRTSGTTANVYRSVTYRDNLGISAFNSNYESLADVGYMYNSRYAVSFTSISGTVTMLSSVSLTSTNLTTYGNYYYGDNYTMSGNNHVLTNPVIGNTIEDNPTSWKGMYMCKSSTSSSCATMYYVVDVDDSNMMYLMEVASGKQINDSSYNYLFGDGITDNGDGTLSLTGTVEEVSKLDWYTKYSNMNNKFVCMPGYYTYDANTGTNTCSDNGTSKVGALRYVTAVTATNFTASSIYKYGYDIELDSGSTYKLIGNGNDNESLQYIYNWPSTSTSNCFNNSNTISDCGYQTLSKSHYTCYNLSGKCRAYYYINYTATSFSYSTLISGGKYVSTDLTDTNNILYEMLYRNDENGNVNTTNSTIKEVIDTWYKNTLLNEYDKYIEDTVYCNDRTITDFGGWNPNGGTTAGNSTLKFKENTVTSDLSCTNVTDRFSTQNNSAKLTYKVGLMSSPEMNLLANYKLRKGSFTYWLASPSSFSNGVNASGLYVDTGSIFSVYVGYARGVRPAISLKSSTKFASGNGSMTNPYVVDYEE